MLPKELSTDHLIFFFFEFFNSAKKFVAFYVCRAGYKLEAAIEKLNVDVVGKVALDSGLSTGGFTDCLLQHGASHVYGVDVGYGQVFKLSHGTFVQQVISRNRKSSFI